jgi:hypothetical protein
MSPDQIPQPLAAVAPALEGGDEVDARRCGRCRRVFEDDPTLDIQGRKEWALCAPCEAIRFPRRARSSATLTLVPPVDASAEGQDSPGRLPERMDL